jgi:site-specific DNA-cytosine methylase
MTISHPSTLSAAAIPASRSASPGKRFGEKDPRHLWPQMHRLIREIRPRWVICENVAGHIELGLDAVLSDLDNAGYTPTLKNNERTAIDGFLSPTVYLFY